MGITLKVISGDRIDVFGNSYYFENNTNNDNNFQVPVLDILGGLLGGPASVGVTGAHGVVTSGQLNSNSGSTGLISSLLTQQATENASTPTKPRAYINYLLFDEQFNCVKKGFSQVGNSNTVKIDHFNDLQNIAIEKNGYIYIYCSNESPVNVFFDNLQAIHTRGPILEETHFYPFGLMMAGISSEAAGALSSKYKFGGKELQSKEFSDGSGIEMYDFGARNYDPQIGRWHVSDPLSDSRDWVSPYNYVQNNPLARIDPSGNLDYPIIRITKQKTGGTADQGVLGYSGGATTKVDLYKVVVTDTEDKNFKMEFAVTRDAWTIASPGSKLASNVGFEPKDGNINHFTGEVMPNGYPQGNGTEALKLKQKDSEVVHAEPNQTSVEMGYRTKDDIAAGVMIHVGGNYQFRGKNKVAASEGCYGVSNPNNSSANPSNSFTNSIMGKIQGQADKSKTNPGHIRVIIEKRENNEYPKTKKVR